MSETDFTALARVLETKAAEAVTKRQELDIAIKEARRAEDAWKRLVEAQKNGHYAEIVGIFRKQAEIFTKLRAKDDKSVPLLESFYKSAETEAKNIAKRFTSLFPKACEEVGIELDSSSRHPNYAFRGFIKIAVEELNLEAHVTARYAQSAAVPLDIALLVARLQLEIKRLFESKRDPKRLLSGLRKAYRAVLREEKKSPGEELPLRRVTNRMSKNLAHFRYDEFSVDLGNAVSSGNTTTNNERLHLNHTRDTRQGMLLYGLESGGYVGFISFKPEVT